MSLDLDAYLQRIGYDGPRHPTLDVLRRLHSLHPATIAFENLDARFGMTPRLDLESLQAKLVQQRRGGWCFEQNRLFQAVLEALGFDVQALIARVRWRQPDSAPETPRTHRLCRVMIDGAPWVADVGFGGQVLTGPLRLVPDEVQRTPHGDFRLVPFGGGFEQQAWLGDLWAPTYRFTPEVAPAIDDEVGNWYCATHPQSHFTFTLMASRTTADERLTLANNDFARRGADGVAHRRLLRSGQELERVLRETFGIDPPASADLDAVIPGHGQA